jgi:hypothetical protein
LSKCRSTISTVDIFAALAATFGFSDRRHRRRNDLIFRRG